MAQTYNDPGGVRAPSRAGDLGYDWHQQPSPAESKNQLADDLPEVRRTWWRLRRRQGVDLPAERDVIVISDWWSP